MTLNNFKKHKLKNFNSFHANLSWKFLHKSASRIIYFVLLYTGLYYFVRKLKVTNFNQQLADKRHLSCKYIDLLYSYFHLLWSWYINRKETYRLQKFEGLKGLQTQRYFFKGGKVEFQCLNEKIARESDEGKVPVLC